MTVTAPPRRPVPAVPVPHEDPEALIEEARRRARRRRLTYAASALFVAGAGASALFGFGGGGHPGAASAVAPSGHVARLPRSKPAPSNPRNGLLAIPLGGNGEGSISAFGPGMLGSPIPIFRCEAINHCWELESAAWSPDGTKLAFSVTSYGAPDYSYDGLHVLDIATGKYTKVPGRDGYDLAWSPDGTTLAVVSRGIFLVGANGSSRALYPGTGDADYSPDLVTRQLAGRVRPNEARASVAHLGGRSRRVAPQAACPPRCLARLVAGRKPDRIPRRLRYPTDDSDWCACDAVVASRALLVDARVGRLQRARHPRRPLVVAGWQGDRHVKDKQRLRHEGRRFGPEAACLGDTRSCECQASASCVAGSAHERLDLPGAIARARTRTEGRARGPYSSLSKT